MDWWRAAPGIIVLLVKLTGTSLFFVFIPHTFPRGNISFIYEENWTEGLHEGMTTFPARATSASAVKAQIPLKPPKWERYRGSYYWFSEDIDVWLNSRMKCQKHNSDLVIITDRKELEFIYNKTTTMDYFIGLVYTGDGDTWLWFDDTEYKRTLFTLNPNGMENECATVRAGEVRPTSCYQKSRWICEKN
ncbi:C-type lectin domain family 5 member A-like isoform X2 [Sceloporus undulatus]|uniref:C-type lectin domain family 5 member A-like isoform X2 n=1 Tax=Sceloporus undulatus TaxID=8520 RepID=UPI001C4C0AE5|nr:C-type lectin domain family 5 member A-like isoform X2 [Sceloporus undulatus]